MSHLLTKDDFKERGILLSPQELRCIELASHDTPVKNMSDVLHITKGTINKYIQSARNKLGVSTTTGAVAIALRRKWIE